MIDMIERKVKNNLRNRERGKILAVLLAVMLILSCIPAGIAFAASAPAAPTISPSGGNIYSSDTVSIGNITTGDTAYYTIASGSTGTTPTLNTAYYLAPFVVSASAGTFTVEAAVYDSVNGWSSMPTATFMVSLSSGGSGSSTPSIQTEAATSITATSAVLNGDVTSNNGYTVTDYGFLWGTSSSSLTNTLDVGANNNNGVFTDTLSNLTAGTTYYFEAYATNSYGTADGAVMSFATTSSQTTTPTTPTTSVFSDVPTTFWGYYAISSLSSKGIVSGYPDGTFEPNADITRAEFAAMLAKALGLSTTGTTGTFTDVTADDWCYGAVNAAASAGLVSGMGNNLFAPNALITREEMAVMVAKALGTKAPAITGTELNAFSDSSTVDSWAVTSMEEAVKAGIVSGMTANTLAPLADATRAQAAVMIYEMLTVS
jgi:hypothetical protein